MSLTLPYPRKCSTCGAVNFRIVGQVYNGDINNFDIKIKCMKCGKIHTHIDSNKYNKQNKTTPIDYQENLEYCIEGQEEALQR